VDFLSVHLEKKLLATVHKIHMLFSALTCCLWHHCCYRTWPITPKHVWSTYISKSVCVKLTCPTVFDVCLEL